MAEDNQFFHCSHTVKMAPIEVPEVDMFDKTIRLVNKLNVTSNAIMGYANDDPANSIHEGSNGINLGATEVIIFGILFLILSVTGLIAICTGCYCGGKKITKWWKKERGHKDSTTIKDNVDVENEMTNIPQDSTDNTQSTPPPFDMKDSSDDSIETITTISHNVEYIPRGQSYII